MPNVRDSETADGDVVVGPEPEGRMSVRVRDTDRGCPGPMGSQETALDDP